MKKLTGLILGILVTLAGSANEIKFETNSWAEIKAKAARENKMIFFDAYTTWCGPCKYLDKNVYTDDAVATYYNDHFINVKFDMENGEGITLAEEFNIQSYPTLLFFLPNGKLAHKYIGAMEADEFITLGNVARDPAKQYYVLKEKAQQLKLTDAEFSNWASLATELEDEEKPDIISKWLNSKSDILGNADIAKTIMKYNDQFTDNQFNYLLANKVRLTSLMNWTDDITSKVLYKKLFGIAIAEYDNNNSSVDAFSAVIKKFDPGKLNYANKDLKFLLAVFMDKDTEKATDLLITYLTDTEQPLNIEELAGWLMDYSSDFAKEDFEKLNETLKSFTLRPIDKDKECWLWVMQMICYTQIGDTAKAKELGEKAYQHPHLPADFKEVLKQTYGFSE